MVTICWCSNIAAKKLRYFNNYQNLSFFDGLVRGMRKMNDAKNAAMV